VYRSLWYIWVYGFWARRKLRWRIPSPVHSPTIAGQSEKGRCRIAEHAKRPWPDRATGIGMFLKFNVVLVTVVTVDNGR
jgi:hypothetical protein